MGIRGLIVLEDVSIQFEIIGMDAKATIVETRDGDERREELECSGEAFMSTLAIAMHWTGTPDYVKDYPAAEKLMKDIRWIP